MGAGVFAKRRFGLGDIGPGKGYLGASLTLVELEQEFAGRDLQVSLTEATHQTRFLNSQVDSLQGREGPDGIHLQLHGTELHPGSLDRSRRLGALALRGSEVAPCRRQEHGRQNHTPETRHRY